MEAFLFFTRSPCCVPGIVLGVGLVNRVPAHVGLVNRVPARVGLVNRVPALMGLAS